MYVFCTLKIVLLSKRSYIQTRDVWCLQQVVMTEANHNSRLHQP